MFGILQLAALSNIVTAQQKKYYKPVPDIAELWWTGSGPRNEDAFIVCLTNLFVIIGYFTHF